MSTQPFIIFDYDDLPPAKPLPEVPNEVRCYQTDDSKVTGVCHHSGRFLSAASEAKPAFYQEHSLEFAGILTGKERRGAHSKAHAHYFPYSPLKILIIPGTILTLWGGSLLVNLLPKIFSLGIFERTIAAFRLFSLEEALIVVGPLISASWAAALWPATLLIVGLLLLVVGIDQQQIFHRIGMSRPLDAIPLLSKHYNVSIKERVEVAMTLSPNGETFVEEPQGEGKVALEIYLDGQDIEKARRAYERKGKEYGFKRLDDFSLGWLYVKPSSYTEFGSKQHLLAMRRHIPKLDNPDITNWFPAATYNYTISPKVFFSHTEISDPMKRPIIWVRPTLKRFSAGHTLQIEFDILTPPGYLQDQQYYADIGHVNRTFLDELANARLKCVHVSVDEHAFPRSSKPIDRSRGRISKERNKVQWQNIRLADIMTGKTFDEQDTYPLTVTFSHPLTQLTSPIEIKFEIEVNKASISGITVNRRHFWLPTGRSAETTDREFRVTNQTLLSGTLKVDPKVFAFEHEITASETIEKGWGWPLTSEKITNLVMELEQFGNTHVKSVVKSTPVTEVENNLAYLRRSWNISGRVYTTNNHPLDFFILLVSRTPLLEGKTTTWGSVTYRCVQVSRKLGEEESAEFLQVEINKRCKASYAFLVKYLELEKEQPDWQTVVPRILGQG